jgi:hypothetical protein
MENILYSKLNQIFQCLVLNTQDLDKGLMNTDANHCGELYLERPSVVGGKGGKGGVGLMENIFYSGLNQIFQSLVIKNQEREVGLMNTDVNHCGEVGVENIFYNKLNQIFQSLVLNTQDLDKGLMNTDANHCGELHLGRPSAVVGGKGGESVAGLMENIFYGKLNKNFQCLVIKNQEREVAWMNTDVNHCGEVLAVPC